MLLGVSLITTVSVSDGVIAVVGSRADVDDGTTVWLATSTGSTVSVTISGVFVASMVSVGCTVSVKDTVGENGVSDG